MAIVGVIAFFAIGVVAVVARTAHENSKLPSEVDMFPEKELVFPGATELSRTYEGEDWHLTIDGRRMGHWTHLERRFQTTMPLPEVRTWYTDELVRRGWTVSDLPETGSSGTGLRRNTKTHEHRLWITTDSRSGQYEVDYRVFRHGSRGAV